MNKRLASIDDGFSSHLVLGALFDGILEIPAIPPPKELRVPTGLTPFSMRGRIDCETEGLCFYENDPMFADVLINPKSYIEEFRTYYAVLTPDCSMYRDAPLLVQAGNHYKRQALGYYFWKHGSYVIPTVRWGNERTYTKWVLPEAVAFLGIPKRSIISIGSYGCIRGKENLYHFQAGLAAMFEHLEPKIVLVYGNKAHGIFEPYEKHAQLKFYPDWIRRMKGENHGNR